MLSSGISVKTASSPNCSQIELLKVWSSGLTEVLMYRYNNTFPVIPESGKSNYRNKTYTAIHRICLFSEKNPNHLSRSKEIENRALHCCLRGPSQISCSKHARTSATSSETKTISSPCISEHLGSALPSSPSQAEDWL